MHKHGNTEKNNVKNYNVNKIMCKHRNTKKNNANKVQCKQNNM